MANFTYVIKDEIGLHARPAGELVKIAKDASCDIMVSKGGAPVNAKKLIALMQLGIKHGDEITVEAEDEAVLETVKKFLEENL